LIGFWGGEEIAEEGESLLGERIKKIYLYRRTIRDMAFSQLKAKYAGSLLGIFWAIINPLLIMFAITFVFKAVFKTQINNFAFFVLAGVFPWMFFSCAVSEAATSILSQQNVLRQFNLPREIIPLSSILSNFANFLIGWIVVYPVFLFLNPKIIVFFPLLVVALILNLIFICGLGVALAVLNVFFRDLGHLLGVLLMFWFWVTPVFYSMDMIPIKLYWIFQINPMTAYIAFYREVIFKAGVPALTLFIQIFFWAFFSLSLGFLVFAQLESKILKKV